MFQRSDLHLIHISPDKLMKGAISQMKMKKKKIRKRRCNVFSGWSYVDLPFAINTGSPKLISHQPLVFHHFLFMPPKHHKKVSASANASGEDNDELALAPRSYRTGPPSTPSPVKSSFVTFLIFIAMLYLCLF